MFKVLSNLIHFLKWPILLSMVLVTVLAAVAVTRLQIDPSIEPLFIKESKEYQLYREFNKQFGSDYIIAVAMATPDLFFKETLEELRTITDEIEAHDQVERVLSLANARDVRHKFLGVKVVPALKEFYEDEENPQKIKNSILSNELYVHNLISPNGKIANILVYLRPSSDEGASSGLFIKKLREYLAARQSDVTRFYIAGAPVEQYDFIRLIRSDQYIFIPIITFLLVAATWILFRSFACMFMAMTIVFTTLIWSIGTIALLGQELNLVTSLLAPVIMIITVVNAIHIMNLFFEIRPHHNSLKDAIILTMDQLGVPCFLTHFTTMLGFISVTLSPVPAIKAFGMYAALGTFYSYLVGLFLTPILLPLLPYRRKGDYFSDKHFFNRFVVGFLEKLEIRWRWFILAGTVLVLVFSYFGIRMLEVDTNMIKQMKPDTPLAVATRFIDRNLTGVYTLGFVFEKKNGEKIIDYETLQKIETFKEYLENKPEIVKVNTITILIKKINSAREDSLEAYKIPDDEGRLEHYFNSMVDSGDPEIFKLITPDLKQLRLEARMKAVGTREGAIVEDETREYMQEHFGRDYIYHLTGNVVLLGNVAKNLVHYQLRGFTFAFLSILVVITIIFRSIKMGLLAAIPNILPILAVYGFMGYVNIEISSATAMISSIVLGMVVDASIHFLHRFRHEFKHRHHYIHSLHHTFRNVGQSLVISTVVLVIGFASSIFASFRPTIYLGLLTSMTIFLALVCTLIVLPVCLVSLRPFGKETPNHRPNFPAHSSKNH